MNAEQLLAYFDRIAEAPDAVARLRRFILDLAVRGKLVEESPNEEPAGRLLEQFDTCQIDCPSGRNARKGHLLSPVTVDEVPFQLPKHWAIIRLGSVINLVNGRAFKPSEWSPQGIPIIRIQNLNDVNAPFNYCDTPVPDKFHVNSGDFLISWSGTPGTSFGAHIWNRGHALLNQHIFRAELIGGVFVHAFLKLAINSRMLELIEQAHGGVGLQHITKPKLESLPLTVPPLAEQHRIVAKVDELMALCDQLEATQTERERRRDRLTAASLHRLNNGADANAFRQHACFHLAHLPRLTTRPEHIKQLRQTILNLAVQGRLVPQDPNDEPAEDILNRISIERRSKPGSISKQNDCHGSILHDASPFRVPSSWLTVTLQSVCLSITDGDHLPPPKTESGIPFLVIGDVRWGNINFAQCRFVSQDYFESLDPNRKPRQGDILYTLVGSFGIPVIVDCTRPFCVQRHIGILRPSPEINVHYLAHVLASTPVFDQAASCATGIAQKTVPLSGLRKTAIPLPPLAEQHRIVAKVDALMALCDRLESQLANAQTDGRHLLEAVLHQILTPEES